MNSVKLSIITFTRNTCDELWDLFDKFHEINDSCLEWLIKDNSESKKAIKTLDEIKKKWSCNSILSINQGKEKSLFDAFNIAINNAKGNYICNFNPDDQIITSGMIYLISEFKNINNDVIVANFTTNKDNSKNFYYPRKSFNVYLDGFRSYLEGCATSLIFSKSIFRKIGGFDPVFNYVSDLDFMLRLIKTIKPSTPYYLGKSIGIYGTNGISSRFSISQFIDIMRVYYLRLGILPAIFLTIKSIYARIKSSIKNFFQI